MVTLALIFGHQMMAGLVEVEGALCWADRDLKNSLPLGEGPNFLLHIPNKNLWLTDLTSCFDTA